MIVKSAAIGAVLGSVFGLWANGLSGVFPGAVIGAAAGIALRKWIFRTFWH
ncbi:MAG TPA: hypothetical protein VFC74_05915 [Oscillospiraceae bacterium]|nr:hypothetical protein [Oscillospiraceae bacterium]